MKSKWVGALLVAALATAVYAASASLAPAAMADKPDPIVLPGMPAAAAQPLAFTASYNVKSVGLSGTPACPDDDLVCGGGTSPRFGTFTYALTPTPSDNVEAILDFGGGNVLALTEEFGASFVLNPGNSTNAPFMSFGHPATIGSEWTLDTADTTGTFSSLTGGSGTDVLHFAGIDGQGVINGTLT
jgi:hypothetical protein